MMMSLRFFVLNLMKLLPIRRLTVYLNLIKNPMKKSKTYIVISKLSKKWKWATKTIMKPHMNKEIKKLDCTQTYLMTFKSTFLL